MKYFLILLAAAGLLMLGSSVFKKRAEPGASTSGPQVQVLEGKLGAGESHALVLDAAGLLHGWGNIVDSRGTVKSALNVPTAAASTASWKSIYVGSRATYALNDSGTLTRIVPRQRDTSRRGDSGSDSTVDMSAEHELPLFAGMLWRKALESWNVGAGIAYGGKLWYWIDDEIPGVARYSETARGTPIHLGGERLFSDVCSSSSRVYAVAEDGTLWRTGDLTDWAERSGSREDVDRTEPEELRPIPVEVPVAKVFCTRDAGRVFVIDRDGYLWGFGYNSLGALGDGTGRSESTTQRVHERAIKRIGKGRWAMIALGHTQTYGIASDGSLWGWGSNRGGLGLGRNDGSDRPALIDKSHTWVAVAATDDNGMALTREGEVYVWGNNSAGILGDGGVSSGRLTPTKVVSKIRYATP